MFSKFLNLDPEKRERILNATLKEFSRKGYEKASTNEIVKDAGISKGLLFHYFNNKRDLFLFLYDHTLEVLMQEFFAKVDLKEGDIFKRLRQIASTKRALLNRFPDMFDFIRVAYYDNTPEDVRNVMEPKNKEYIMESFHKIFSGMDTSRFKEGIDTAKAVDIIMWTLEGLSVRYQDTMKKNNVGEETYSEIYKEVDNYLDMLQAQFYK